MPALEEATGARIEARRQLLQDSVGTRVPERLEDALVVDRGLGAAERDILANSELVGREILKEYADPPAQHLRRNLTQVDATDLHCAPVGIVETEQQLHEGTLAGAVLPHQRDQLPCLDVQREPINGRSGPARVSERHVGELDSVREPVGYRRRLRRGRCRDHRLDREEREVVVEEGGVLVHGDEGARDIAERARYRRERADHEDDPSRVDQPGDAAPRDERIGERETRSGDDAGAE